MLIGLFSAALYSLGNPHFGVVKLFQTLKVNDVFHEHNYMPHGN